MAKFTDVMRWVAQLDNSDVLKGFKEIEDQGTKSLDEVGDKSEGLGDRFKGAGGKMGKALVAGFAAVGVGAIILGEIDKAFARQDSLNVVRGRFALTADEAKKYGKIAGDLYADGWGDGIEEVQQAVAVTFEKLEIESEDTGKKLARDALAVAKTWDTDVDAVIRSVGQLMQNDLVDSSQDAMDLVVAAFQEGGDEAGDLLDTIDEYSQHWASMGLSGEDALNQIVHGFQNGQRDADKMADAVKEMGIRIREGADPVREALQDIGLDADDVVEAFLEGGPRARDAFLDVVDGLAQGQAQGEDTENAVALIGTQFEDLGPTALESLAAVDGALENTAGRAESLADAVEATEWEKFQRNGESALGAVGNYIASEVNPAFEAANDLWDGVFGGDDDTNRDGARRFLQGVTDDLRKLVDAEREATDATEDATDATEDRSDSVSDLNNWVDRAAYLQEQYEAATERAQAADEAAAAAAEERKQKLEALIDAVQRSIDSTFNYESATRDAERAVNDYERAVETAAEVMEDSEATARDKEEVLWAVRDAEIGAAGGVMEAARAFAEEQGAAEGSTESVRLQKEELQRLADKFPFLRDEIDLFIAKLNAIPSHKSVTVSVSQVGNVGVGGTIGGLGHSGARAAGGPVEAGGMYRVGEGGKPELLESGGQHYLIPGDQRGSVTPAKHGSVAGGGGEVRDIHLHFDARGAIGMNEQQVKRWLVESLRQHVRFNGSIKGVTG